jgi:HEAT repeat protein
MKTTTIRGALAAALLLAGHAQAQEALARRVAAAPDGEVRISFAAKPGVCGWEEGISTARGTREGRRTVINGSVRQTEDCIEGPVRVALTKRGGRVTDVKTRVGHPFRDRGERVTDLGTVEPREASDYLLALAERGTDAEAGKDAIFPATLAQGVTTWPALLRIARRESLASGVRSGAVFWLSQEASEAATRGLQEIVDDDGDQEVRKQAVFSLSRRPNDEAVPALIRIARTHRDPELRRSALFWLGRSGDPRALAVFEELLR